MIYTLTFNPSIDYLVFTNQVQLGTLNRTKDEKITFGGKGLNVSYMLNQLGTKNIALGFLAGFTGYEIKRQLDDLNINNDFIFLKEGNSRINIKLNDLKETEINGNGPIISKEGIDELYQKLDCIKEDDYLILAGSVQNSVPNTIYGDLMNYLKDRKVNFVIDADKGLLSEALIYQPFLIKPNLEELKMTLNMRINCNDDIIMGAKILKEKGAKNVLVSLGKDGAILIDENDNIYTQKTISSKVVKTVGSGDSMLAGFISNYLKNKDYYQALIFSVACGSASAFSKGLASKESIGQVYQKLLLNS
jgi:1-phosphofructokinase